MTSTEMKAVIFDLEQEERRIIEAKKRAYQELIKIIEIEKKEQIKIQEKITKELEAQNEATIPEKKS
jgi:hypothetical protein